MRYAISLVTLIGACHANAPASPVGATVVTPDTARDADAGATPGAGMRTAYASTAPAAIPWTERFDLDGDGRSDRIVPSFSGGAHCCYRVAVELTRTGRTIPLPFQLDGGYVGGLDLSEPTHFDVQQREGRPLPELIMEIETYDGVPAPLPSAWRRQFGITSHHIAVSFPNATVTARDLP